jgi:hypothetical protein
MLDVLGKDCFEVTATEDEHPVEAFAPDGADDALTDHLGPGLSGQSLAGLWMTSKEVTTRIASERWSPSAPPPPHPEPPEKRCPKPGPDPTVHL